MAYESIDAVQRLLSTSYFSRTLNAKKASGRALGTFVELIFYYILKSWRFQKNMAIETRLPEYGIPALSHNVEFTLHKIKNIFAPKPLNTTTVITSCQIIRDNQLKDIAGFKASPTKKFFSNSQYPVIKNGLIVGTINDYFIIAYADTSAMTYQLYTLNVSPFAMFECKRVGKEGSLRGPQTIEKAKQGAYVAKSVSSLQKIVMPDGTIDGIYFGENSKPHFEVYDILVKSIINGSITSISNFILTVGIVSNHGNWFTSNNMNKELQILARSYDWLLFLQDKGLTTFVKDFLNIVSCKAAFEYSYSINPDTNRKNPNIFTKSQILYDADMHLTQYLKDNQAKILSWFNVISPQNKTILDLKHCLDLLSK